MFQNTEQLTLSAVLERISQNHHIVARTSFEADAYVAIVYENAEQTEFGSVLLERMYEGEDIYIVCNPTLHPNIGTALLTAARDLANEVGVFYEG